MPGLLKPTAQCPVCGDGLAALVDTTSAVTVKREFFHEPVDGVRRSPCHRTYTDSMLAHQERRALEVHPVQ